MTDRLFVCVVSTLVAWCWAAAQGQAGDLPSPRGQTSQAVGDWPADHAAVRPIPLGAVRLGGFLGDRVDTNNRVSLLAGLESPIPAGFEARAAGREVPSIARRLAADSDMHKWLEGACYAVGQDAGLTELAAAVERYVAMMVSLQEPDGYLGTRVNPAAPFDERVAHDLYVAGHFIEAAVAHYHATGRTDLIESAGKLADFYIRAWRQEHPYYKIVGQREHPEIEPALVRLYRATGEDRYLEFADAIASMAKVGPRLEDVHAGGGARHAVRLCYLLTGLAELYLTTGRENYRAHLASLWDEIVTKRMYVTGGIGYNERVPAEPFDLPQCLDDNPNRDIAETCASVAMMMFSWRMHAITGESRYFDTIETILYNHYLGAVSIDHLGVFYYNPLRRVGDMTGYTDHGAPPGRRLRLPDIHSTACCLPNSWRFFAQLPEYVFSTRSTPADTVLVNLYTDATATHRLSDNTALRIEMRTNYPHEGTVRLRVEPERATRFALALRVPGWCELPSVSVAGEPPQRIESGNYHRIERMWQPGDEVVLELPMTPAVVLSRFEVAANRGQAALRRGPLVYCLEKQDTAGLDLAQAVIALDQDDPAGSLKVERDGQLGCYVLRARTGRRHVPDNADALYHSAGTLAPRDVREVTFIPFYLRANRLPDSRWVTFLPFYSH